MLRRWWILGGLVALGLGLSATELAVAQGLVPATLQLAFVPEWVVEDNARGGAPPAGLLAALDSGVVDRPVFRWQRGAIQRSVLVLKPIRVLSAEESAPLGGRGEFQLVAARAPRGSAAWVNVEVRPVSGKPDDVLVLEVGGEVYTRWQVLNRLLVDTPGGLQELRLTPPALIPGAGVPVIRTAFGLPFALPDAAGRFRGAGAVDFLVARSLVEVLSRSAVTVDGLTDVTVLDGGAWREGDRVYVRVPLERLGAGAPRVVMGWRTRIPQDFEPRGESFMPPFR